MEEAGENLIVCITAAMTGGYKQRLFYLGALFVLGLSLTIPASAENAHAPKTTVKVLATVPQKYAKIFTPFFFPRNKKAAYIVQNKDESFVVFGGREGRHFTNVSSLSAQKTTLTYQAYDVNGNKSFFIINNDKEREIAGGQNISLSLGKRIIFNEHNIEINGRLIFPDLTKHFSSLPWIQRLSISPDGRTLAFSGDLENQYVMATMDIVKRELKAQSDRTYDYFFSSAVFSPDSKTIAYIAEKNGEIFVVKGEKELTHYSADKFYISGLIFSPDSMAFAYILENKKTAKFQVVTEDGAGEEYDSVRGVTFSPDHSQMGYIASEGNEMHIVMNGEEVSSFDSQEFPAPIFLSFSPANNKLAYVVATWDESMIFFDGVQISEKFDSISNLAFSRDGKKLLFGATRKNASGDVEIIAGEIRL